MNTLVIVLIAAVVLVAAYVFYGRWLANKWGIDPKAETPAVKFNDGKDYVQTKEIIDENKSKKGKIMTSPMVGTFYLKPSPNAEPYVKVGQNVKKGDVLCIIEAMKLMNEIESEYDGIIEEILVKDAECVEYGKPLFRIS